jgi:hypothetical protein
MTETVTKKKVTKKKVAKKKAAVVERKADTAKTDRPKRAESRAKRQRPKRLGPVGSFRDKLGVQGKDAEYRYRWFAATSEKDKRIFDAVQAGWEMVDATVESEMEIGEEAVTHSKKWGSIYRVPASRGGNEEYMYLMRIPEDWAIEVDAMKADEVDKRDAAITRERDSHDNEDGQYGSTKVDHAIGSIRKRAGQ